MKKIFTLVILAIGLIACTEQRDLYVNNTALFKVKADWTFSTIIPTSATAFVFNGNGNVLQNPFMSPATSTQPQKIEPGTYNVIVFNKFMYAPNESEFDYIAFKNTNNFSQFAITLTPNVKVNRVFKSSEDEIAVNNPDVLALAAVRNVTVKGGNLHAKKYDNGDLVDNIGQYISDSITVKPVKITRTLKIIVNTKNFKDKFVLYATLRGFPQEINISTRKPQGSTNVSYAAIKLNKTDQTTSSRTTPTSNISILTSETLTYFGPWWDDADGQKQYYLEILARYNGQPTVYSYKFDISKKVEGVVLRSMQENISLIRLEENNYSQGYTFTGVPPTLNTDEIEVSLDLPDLIEDDNINVGIDDWDDVVIIPVKI